MEGRINFNETMGDKNVFDLLLLTSDSDCWSWPDPQKLDS